MAEPQKIAAFLVLAGLCVNFYGAFQLAYMDPMQGAPKPLLRNLPRVVSGKRALGGVGAKPPDRDKLKAAFWRYIMWGFLLQIAGTLLWLFAGLAGA